MNTGTIHRSDDAIRRAYIANPSRPCRHPAGALDMGGTFSTGSRPWLPICRPLRGLNPCDMSLSPNTRLTPHVALNPRCMPLSSDTNQTPNVASNPRRGWNIRSHGRKPVENQHNDDIAPAGWRHGMFLEYPGGVTDISPGLSEATPQVKCTPRSTTLEGWQTWTGEPLQTTRWKDLSMKLFLAPLLLALALAGCTESRTPAGTQSQAPESTASPAPPPAVANLATPPAGQDQLAPLGVNVTVFDPAGETSAMLKRIGCRVTTLEQKGAAPALLAVGRKALSDGKALPLDLEIYVRDGGRLILFAQNPDWARKLLRLRVAEYLARRVFAVSANHPVCAGLDADDLRDWTGESRLVDPKPEVPDVTKGSPYGWRWGGRGAVASFSVEKPHHAGWRPILECEWDLAYSPLMELDYGKGMVFLCGLDFEDHAEADPAARQLARQFIAYAATRAPQPRRAAFLMGNESDRQLLDSMGLEYKESGTVPATSDAVLVLGQAAVDEAALRRFLEAGGKALVLARTDTAAPLGITLAAKADCLGSTVVPAWPECAGLSVSDLRARAPYPGHVFTAGGEIGADGMLARVKVGQGVAVLSQFDPRTLNADEKTYLRYTRWRQTRVLTQLLANLGASFQQDAAIFKADNRLMAIPLAGEWRARQIVALPSAPFENKPKNVFSKEAKAAVLAATDDDWQAVQLPSEWEKFGGPWADTDGEAVFRKTVTIPEEWQGLDLELSLGQLDDFDDTFWNGQLVGGIDQSDPAAWSKKRRYLIPARMVKPGEENRIAVRVFDHFGGGGFTGRPEEMSIEPKRPGEVGWYHADYLRDFERGDDPYRYYRW